jgi:23S rRNA (cytidine1920-2'-O)/16S rRNA (cytidine1409-2'-O)-methyltransferase
MKRLDAVLVQLALAPSRTKAQRMIEAGEVEVQIGCEWKCIRQCSFSVKDLAVRVQPESQTLKYVSRGGLKLEGALKHLKLEVKGWHCLDIGLSTGGFSDCLLQHGAGHVVGIDVGHGQLAEKLKTEAKLKQFEGVHVRDLPKMRSELVGGVALTVVDVSFISMAHVLPVLSELLPKGARLLALVKPQFEVGAVNLDKNGIVQDPKLFVEVKAEVLRALEKYGFSSIDYFASDVKGQDGNQEFFVFALRT